MSDTISHATQGGLLLLAPFIARIRRRMWIWILALIGGSVGVLPDLIGAYGNFIKHDHWTLYRSAHRGAIAEILQYVPMYWLHLYTDRLTHGPGHRWWILSERLWMEVLFWVLNLAVIGIYVRIRRKMRRDSTVVPET